MVEDKPLIDFQDAFEIQRSMQRNVYGDDVTQMEGKVLAGYISFNVLAMTDELHELLNETCWKPWTATEENNLIAAQGELVDVFHFFLNLMDATNLTPEALLEKYKEKQMRNIQRQLDKYDGRSTKCPGCKRDFGDIDVTRGDTAGKVTRTIVTYTDNTTEVICSPYCPGPLPEGKAVRSAETVRVGPNGK